jgi:hypothetical protein
MSMTTSTPAWPPSTPSEARVTTLWDGQTGPLRGPIGRRNWGLMAPVRGRPAWDAAGVDQQTPGTPGQAGKFEGCPGWIRRADPKRVDGGDAIDMPPELFGGPPLTRWARNIPLRRLTSIRDGTPAWRRRQPRRPDHGHRTDQPTERRCISRDHQVLVGHGHRHTLTPHGIEAGEGPEHDHAVVGGQVDVGAGLGDRFAGGPPDGQDGAIQ